MSFWLVNQGEPLNYKGDETVHKRALLSVWDKTGIVDFAKGLVARGFEILSTGGTMTALQKAGVAVTKVEQVTGVPEMMGGRVKTLHPAVLAGILARRKVESDMAELQSQGYQPVDVVAVNLYPFVQTISRPDATFGEAMENIDIGGPTMVRAAAKNHKSVWVVVDPADYPLVLDSVREPSQDAQSQVRRQLAAKAFAHTAEYDGAISGFFAKVCAQGDFPLHLSRQFKLKSQLRYGENPHQQAAFYVDASAGPDNLAGARQLHGKELSFNNLNDANAALLAAREFSQTAVVALKHTNPCGVGISAEGDLARAFRRAHAGDPVSIFGGIVACNRMVDEETARLMAGIFLEVILAPGFTKQALEILTTKKNLRLLELQEPGTTDSTTAWNYKAIAGGLLVETEDCIEDDPSSWRCVTKNSVPDDAREDLLLAWKVVKHVKSNAIVLAKSGATVGIGAGQMNRVQAAEIALSAAGEKARGSVLASDAFFPFDDVVRVAAKGGVRAIVQPGGSVRDEDSIRACDELGIPMLFTGIRHFRH